MENIFLGIKYVIFFGMQAVVVAVMGITLLAGLYQIVRDTVQEARREDQLAPEAI